MLVTDYITLGTDFVLTGLTFVGTYYAFVAGNLFKGDLIMERVWRLATLAFGIFAFFSAIDFILTADNIPAVGVHPIRIGAVLSVSIFIVSVILLVRWGRSTMEPRTQPSRQYPPR